MDLPVRCVVTVPRAEGSNTGAPHFGHADARVETSVPQSGHVVSAIRIKAGESSNEN